ncbi:MAG: hypothetical protein ACTSWX_08025 [Promethearchaeota archaeon]
MIKGIIIIKFDMEAPDIVENEQVIQQEELEEEIEDEEEEENEGVEENESINEPAKERRKNVQIIPKLEKWEIINEYFADKKDKPNNELIDVIMKSFIATATLKDLNFRAFPYKFYIVPLKQQKDIIKYCTIYILDIFESLEIVKIHPTEIQDSILENISNKIALTNRIRNIYIEKNNILEKVEKVDVLKNEIGSTANKLIDEGKYEDAQKIIKLAKEIPSKLVNTYSKSKKEVKGGHFKNAEKNLRDAFNLAKKINDEGLKAYLELKIETVKRIPSYQKEVKSKYSSISKKLLKYNTFIPYSSQIPKLHRCMELLDKLEEDDQIDQITDLEKLLVEAQQYVRSLRDIDRQIKQITKLLKE